ncbi:transcription factor HBP-1b(c38)-like isoform X2 [Miscanthus floridulus]|uniref:transcription factor HBP-1b(c38)-like isoform X2 n=1 Tax=Miscanthus floridulus TaxID=154761 RepID=UPI003459B9AC
MALVASDRLQPLATSGSAPGRYVTSGPVGGGAMGIYERQRHLVAAGVWGEPFRPDANAMALPLPLAAVVPTVTVATTPAPLDVVEAEEVKFGKLLLQAQQDDVAPLVEEEAPPPSSDSFGHDDDARPRDKIQRRLAQNREAARKSRLRKKAYIQNLETSRMKLAQLEQELTMARRQQHGAYGVGGGGVTPPPPPPAPVDPRVAAFELEYAHWVEEQGRQATELRAALQSHAPDVQLRVLVDAGLEHYGALFQAKARAARSDAFFVLSGVWRAPAERFFLWIGGFRPSELLKVLAPQLDPLLELQAAEVRKLQNTARQLEDALTQGMNKLQQTLVETLMTVDVSPDGAAGGGGYAAQQMASAVGKLADLVDFVDKADHLRQQTLRNMHKILTPRQAARGLLALADYGQRLRALSSLWAARRREPA